MRPFSGFVISLRKARFKPHFKRRIASPVIRLSYGIRIYVLVVANSGTIVFFMKIHGIWEGLTIFDLW